MLQGCYWIALNESCLTQNNLNRRGFQLVNRCYLCMENEETVNHLFLHCPVATNLWNMFYCLSGLKWVMPQNLRDAQMSWSLWRVDKTIKKIWLMISAAIFWCLWNERNCRCFDGISTPNHFLKAKCLLNLFCWTKLANVISTDQLMDFVSSFVLE